MPRFDTRLPVLSRSLSVRADSLDEEKRTVDLVFATETPNPSYDWDIGEYDEVLACSEQACDLSRFRSGAALLREHDRKAQIGVIESAKFENGVGIATARFSKSAMGEQEFQDVKAGIRRNFSVSYRVNKLDKVGEREGRPVWQANSWEALEVSLVSVPADKACQALRSIKDRPLENTHPVTFNITDPMLRQLNPKFRSLFSEADKGDNATSGNGGQTQKPDPAKEKAERDRLRAEERASIIARDKEIDETVASFKKAGCDVSEMVSKARSEDWTIEKFRVESIKMLGERQGQPTPSGRVEVLDSRIRPATPGDAFIQSEEFRAFAKRRGAQRAARVENVVNFLESNIQSRTTSTTAIAGFTNPDYQAGIKLIGLQRLTVRDLLAPGTTGSNAIIYRREVSHTNTAAMVAEGAAKPEASFDTEEITANVRKIAVWTKETEELVMDFPAFASYINARLPFMILQTEETELLNGDGTGQHLLGILQTVGILTQAKGADTVPDAIYKGITKIRTTVGGFAEPDGIVVHPNDWQDVRLSKDGNQQYYAGGPFMGAYGNGGIAQDAIWGKTVVITTAITEGTLLVGAFRLGAQIFDRQGLTIETTNTDQDDFIKNLITIRAEKRLALAVYFPKFFCTVTGV